MKDLIHGVPKCESLSHFIKYFLKFNRLNIQVSLRECGETSFLNCFLTNTKMYITISQDSSEVICLTKHGDLAAVEFSACYLFEFNYNFLVN